MDSIHHYSVIAIKFTVSPMFPYLGCAAFLHLSIINQGKISPCSGSYAVYMGHTSGPTILCLRWLHWRKTYAWWSPAYTLLNLLYCIRQPIWPKNKHCRRDYWKPPISNPLYTHTHKWKCTYTLLGTKTSENAFMPTKQTHRTPDKEWSHSNS